MYRPPGASETYYEQMVDVLEHFTNCTNHVIVMGDFNYNCAPDVNDCRHINHIEQLTGLSRIVSAPTRVTMTTSRLIDIIFTSDPEKHVMTGVVLLSLSDHHMPYTIIRNSTVTSIATNTITFRNYKTFVHAALKKDVYEAMPHVTQRISSENLDVHEAWIAWTQVFFDMLLY